MRAQLAATRELIEALQKTQRNAAQAAENPPIENAVVSQSPQLARALTWLAAYPDMCGLSLRKAAASAGVSEATMRKAIASRKGSER